MKVDFQGSRVTSDPSAKASGRQADGGLILVRELDERLGFGELIEHHLTDSRGKNAQLPLADLLRQSAYSRLAGYEDVNNAQRLVKAGGRLIKHARYYWLLLAESVAAATRRGSLEPRCEGSRDYPALRD